MSHGLAVDCVGHPPGAALVAAGYRAVALYVGTPGLRKSPTPALVADYLDHGLELILLYEDDATSWMGGRARGRADANAVRLHLAALGIDWAQVGCVYHAFDEDVPAAELHVVDDYVAGVAEVYGGPGRVGAYGSRALIAHLLDAGTARLAWASAGWQYGHIDPRCVLEQEVLPVKVGSVPCDVDVILAADFGQYPTARASAVAAAPPAVPAASRTASEESVSLIKLDPTPLPADLPSGRRWQDTDPATWPMGPEAHTALVPAVQGGWRGKGSISSITCGWAGTQDGPGPDGRVKPSGFIQYMRIFGGGNINYSDWTAVEVVTNVALIGNRSLPMIPLPEWCNFLVVRYSAPGGLYLGLEYEY